MIERIADRIVESLILSHTIEIEDVSVYQYGFEIMLSTIVSILIALILGIALHCVAAATAFLTMFIILRSVGGGYHAPTYLQCNLLFAFVTAVVLLSYKFVPIAQFTVLHYSILFFSIIVAIAYAPVENANKPLSIVQKKYGRFLSVALTVLLALLSCLLEILILSPYSILIDMTVLVVSVSMYVTDTTRGGE